ncbi:hypothetical protein [Burkholderia ubonensis]|uniref:hypothetical protein n=1 Tax=Burkholderia ubonensis TaxID=101571 RepID=UPI000ADBA2DF|nr:hypothetical protein [Burkholderia ubonensis]
MSSVDQISSASSRPAWLTDTYPKLVDHYVDRLAIGWRRRPALLARPAWDFLDLATFDDRLSAAMEALRVSEAAARTHLYGLLNEDTVRPGELFAAALYALTVNDSPMWDAGESLSVAVPTLRLPLFDALEWAPPSALLKTSIDRLPLADRLRLVGLRYHDFDGIGESALADLQTRLDPEPDEIRAALQLLSHLGRADLAPAAQPYLRHGAPHVRLEAARILLLLATADHAPMAVEVLMALVSDADPELAEAATRCLVAHAPQSTDEVLAMLDGPATLRLRVKASGWSGRLAQVPTLMAHLGNRATARLAGTALTWITGSDPDLHGWHAPKPSMPSSDAVDGDDRLPASDPDKPLAWPDADAFARWWHRAGSTLDAGSRHFLGAPLTAHWLAVVMTSGPLPFRHLAAEHWQRMTHGPLFPTNLPAHAQRARFAGFFGEAS